VIKRLAGSGLLDSGGGMSPFTSALGLGLVESGALEQNIHRLRAEYAARLNALEAALRRHIPGAQFSTPQGGFFFWVHLPGVETAELRPKARELKVDLRQGALFSSRKGLSDYCRLAFSYYGPQDIEEGVKRLGECLAQGGRPAQG
jgi:2-aminoadipate transaminase